MQHNFKTLILIDDNEIDLKINSKLVSIYNLFDEIILFNSGENALKYLILEKNNKLNKPILILLDIQMPEMDGFEFLIHYKLLPTIITDKCVIAMLSSTLDFGDIKKAEANPFVISLLKKPLNVNEVLNLLNTK